jgi:hypothetical protein
VPSKSVARLGITVAVAGVAMVTSILPAAARDGIIGDRMTVCPQSLPNQVLPVRTQPLGADAGSLKYPETFLVKRTDPSGEWVYGFAYGDINANYWVQNGYFC